MLLGNILTPIPCVILFTAVFKLLGTGRPDQQPLSRLGSVGGGSDKLRLLTCGAQKQRRELEVRGSEVTRNQWRHRVNIQTTKAHRHRRRGQCAQHVNARRVLTEREDTSSSIFVSERRVRLGSKTSRG